MLRVVRGGARVCRRRRVGAGRVGHTGGRRAATWLAVLATAATLSVSAAEAAQAVLEGRVVAAADGQPLAGVPVGAVRLGRLEALAPGAVVKPERQATTGEDGRFRFEVPTATEGLERVTVFTASPRYTNQILGGATFGTALPRVGDLRAPAVRAVDLRQPGVTVEFALAPAERNLEAVRVPMRDGVRLATDVYRPGDGAGPWPVLLMRTPYGRAKLGEGAATQATEAGYVLVAQDVRGRFDSEGENLAFLFDGWGQQQDGVDTAAWVVRQPWCDGKIGTLGGSALGITQILTAAAEPPGVVCQSISVACGSLFHHAAYIGGAFGKALVEDWTSQNHYDPKCLAMMREHRRYDDFWRALDTRERADRVHVPGLFMGGWYDVFSQGTIDAFLWRQAHGGAGAKGRQKLVMGPWCHGRGKTGELEYPAESKRTPAVFDGLRWFDAWLKGEANGAMEAPAVTYYVMGAVGEPGARGNEWHTADVWPVPSHPTPLYLRAGKALALATPEPRPTPLSYEFDPAKPVPTHGGHNLTIPNGPMDQQPVEDRPDVLLFTTEPLSEPWEITGRVTAKLWVSSTAPDTDFTVKLCDVYPDGRSMLVLDGILRLRFRNGLDREEDLTPGQTVPVEIDLWSTSLVVNRGHRIRVAVSSSNYPRFDVNPNTGTAGVTAGDAPRPATNTVHLGPDCPSHIVLPVIRGPLAAAGRP